MDQSKEQVSFWEPYLKSMARYAVGKILIGITITQPFFQVGTHRANGMGHIAAWSTMFKHPAQGLKEAYLRECVKALVKAPTLPLMQEWVKNLYIIMGREDLSQDKYAVNLLAGSGVGLADGVITTPIERAKTWAVARKEGDPTFFQYLKQGNQDWKTKIGKFYEGALITTAKQTVLATAFFTCMDYYPKKVKEQFGETPWNNLASSVLTGATVALVQGPLNMIKVKKQAPKGLANVSAADIAKNTVKERGLGGLVAGAGYFAGITIFSYTISGYVQNIALKELGLAEEKSGSSHSR